MKIICSCFFLLLFVVFSPLQAQIDTLPPTMDEPYPAPVSTADISREKASFIGLFKDWNVGNLHVYSFKGEKPGQDYYFDGTPITSNFAPLLPEDIGYMTRLRGNEPLAIGSLRGEFDLYIIRLSGAQNHDLALFEFIDDKLVFKKLLATYRCDVDGCIQMDSWILDFDGDVRLDLIQKQRRTDPFGKVLRTETSVYKMSDDGRFRKYQGAKKIDPANYRFENL